MAETDDLGNHTAAVIPPMATTAGFDGFFVETYPSLARALALALGDTELGRDAAAEGFTRALPRWDRVSTYDNPAGWVYRVGLNWGRSRWRKRQREVAGRDPVETSTALGASDPDLVAAIARLSADHRDVVVGRYYLDWSEAQLAAALDVAPGTIKSRLSRALQALAEHMEHDHG